MSEIENFTIKMENNSNGNPIYIGKAARGSSLSSSVWQIQKLTYDANDGTTDVQWAEGLNKFSFIWNDRATYNYK